MAHLRNGQDLILPAAQFWARELCHGAQFVFVMLDNNDYPSVPITQVSSDL